MRAAALIAICCLLGMQLVAQTSTTHLSGIVVDQNGAPVAGVLVKVVDQNYDYTTRMGEFDIVLHAGVKPGSRVVVVVEKRGWRLRTPTDPAITVPDGSAANPVRLVIEPLQSDAGTGLDKNINVARPIEGGWKESPCFGSISQSTSYFLGVLTDIRFRSERFNTALYWGTIGQPKSADFGTGLESSIDTSGTSGQLLTCITLDSRPKVGRTVTVAVRGVDITIKTDLAHWKPTGDLNTIGKFALYKASVVLPDPDWIVFRSARLIPVSRSADSMLEVVFENLSKNTSPVSKLLILASDDWGSACLNPAPRIPSVNVVLDWQELGSKGPSAGIGGWTDFSDAKVAVRVSVQPANCGHHSNDFVAEIPVQLDLEPGSTSRFTFHIQGLQGVVASATGHTAGKKLYEWGRLSVAVEESSVSPQRRTIELF